MVYLVGIDVGTTNTKAVVYDPERGEVIALGRHPTRTYHPRPGWSEFDPAQIWQGVAESLRQALAQVPSTASIAGVGVSSMGEAGIPIDASGEYLYPIIAWYDPRAEPQLDALCRKLGTYEIFDITGQSPRNIFSLPKIVWLQEHHPDIVRRAGRWLCMEDFVIWKLSGEYATDYSVASRTLAFDQRQRFWSSRILGSVGLSADLFPMPFPSGTAVGRVTAKAAEETGLPIGAPVVTGGHDHLVGALAVGVLAEGEVLDSTGTAEAVLAPLSFYRPDRRLFDSGFSFYHHTVRGQYVVIGGNSAGGASVDWLSRSVLGLEEGPSKEFFAAAAEVAAGSQGLFFLPHLVGSGTPENDAASRGAFVGLTPFHNRGHFARAVLEGVCYWLRSNLDEIESIVGKRIAEITAIGGATQSPFWLQLKADVTGRSVRVPHVPEAVAVGAALLAGCGVGLFANERQAAASVNAFQEVRKPDEKEAAAYERWYEEVYKSLYASLRDSHHRIQQAFGS